MDDSQTKQKGQMKYIKIKGNPISQKRHRHHRFGTYDPSSKDKKITIPIIVDQFMEKPYEGALEICLHFICKRPKAHYGTGRNKNIIKASAPYYNTKKSDIDNYIKYYLDCMNKICYKDDAQIVNIKATKSYVDECEKPYTEIIIEQLNDY